jgi:protein involved in polysaccharide export with SLBB domain
MAAIASFGLWTSATAQVPIPLQEQISQFNNLPAAQQQALIRELQRQLPPAQREAIIGMLQRRQAEAQEAGAAEEEGVPEVTRPEPELDLEELFPKFGPGDTLVVEFELRGTGDTRSGTEALGVSAARPVTVTPSPLETLTPEEQIELAEFLERLEDGNPYQLDRSGQLYLPGVPAIQLAGLDVDQATVRLRAERQLRPFDMTITLLPLQPIGTDALEPFGYDLFGDDAPSTFAPATDIPVPVDYVIGPGDTINIQLFGNTNAEYFLTVNRDGTVTFPEIGPVNVSGLLFTDLRNTINERVSEQMIGVRASTTLGELRSIRVFVLGDVAYPGPFTVSGLATMTNALFASGGVKEIGSLRNIALLRNGDTVTTLDLYDLLLRGDTRGDSRLQPGDVIFVPPIGAKVAVDGEVRRPAVYEVKGEQSVNELIALAGGLNATANRAAIKLERIVPGRGITVADLNLAGAASGQQAVRDGDVLRVLPNLEQLEGSVRLAGNVQRPGLYQWSEGMVLSELLPGPDLVKPLSDLNYVLIRRENAPNVDVDALSTDIQAVWERRPGAADIALEPRDTVYVFHLEIGRRQFVEPIIKELRAQAEPNEPLPIVRVGGQVRAEGDYPLEPGMRVSDLLRAGGGLSDAAYAIEAELTRYAVVNGEYRETELMAVDLAAVRRGDATANVALAPYDYLNIKEVSRWRGQQTVTLRGEVVFPGTYPIRQGETLRSVLERAGGLTEFAFPQGGVFTRAEVREREREQLRTLANRVEADLASLSLSDPDVGDAINIGQTLLNQLRNTQPTGRVTIRLDDIIAGRAVTDLILQDGDELSVPEFRQEVAVLGEVQYPTSHIYEPGLERDDYVGRSGGLTSRADKGRVYVVRANGEVVTGGGARWFSRGTGLEIQPGDTVVAPIEVDRLRPLALWASVTQIAYNLAIAAAAVNSF